MQSFPPPQGATTAPDQSAGTPFVTTAPFLQGIVLCILALLCVGIKISDLFNLDAFLVLGLGCLLGFIINPRRLFVPAALFVPLGLVNVLASNKVINGGSSVAYYFIALAIGLLVLAQVVRLKLGWVQPGALGPGLFILLFGFAQLEASNNGGLGQFLYSLWLPAIVLGALGLTYLAMSAFGRPKA